MGGTTFEHYMDGADVRTAFNEAREQAAHEHGHGGYTGTIAEKPGYTVITPTPLLEVEANALAQKLIDSDDPRIRDKWEAAGAIPVIKSTRTVRLKETFEYTPSGQQVPYGQVEPNLLAAVTPLVKLRKGETIKGVVLLRYSEPNRGGYGGYGNGGFRSAASVRTTNCEAEVVINKPPSFRVAPVVLEVPGGLDHDQQRKEIQKQIDTMRLKAGERVIDWRSLESTPGTAKVAAVAPKGATETRFIVIANRKQGFVTHTIPIKPHGTWETGFTSQAEARAWAVEICGVEKNWTGMGPLASLGDDAVLEIESVTRRADGQPLVAISRTVGKRLVNVDVTVKLASTATTTSPDGWLFFGWASC